jgi:hypothetical protein
MVILQQGFCFWAVLKFCCFADRILFDVRLSGFFFFFFFFFFVESGCENCKVLEMQGDRERVGECTTHSFEG